MSFSQTLVEVTTIRLHMIVESVHPAVQLMNNEQRVVNYLRHHAGEHSAEEDYRCCCYCWGIMLFRTTDSDMGDFQEFPAPSLREIAAFTRARGSRRGWGRIVSRPAVDYVSDLED